MTERGERDRLAEIENNFLGHPEDDYYFVEARDFHWLIGEVKRLRGGLAYLKGMAQDADNVKLMDQIDEALTDA
jgi:hypothetical protein